MFVIEDCRGYFVIQTINSQCDNKYCFWFCTDLQASVSIMNAKWQIFLLKNLKWRDIAIINNL